MYIETRFFDSGKVEAKLHKGFSYPQIEQSNDFDTYVESIGDSNTRVQADFDNSSDYESLEAWIEELEIELDDIVGLVLDLNDGKWVNITAYVERRVTAFGRVMRQTGYKPGRYNQR